MRRLDRDGHVEQYGAAEGLTHTTVAAIYDDRRGELWIGGDDGLSRLRGNRFENVAIQNDAPRSRRSRVIIADNSGDLWLGLTFFGVTRVAREDIANGINDPSSRLRYRLHNASFGGGYPTFHHDGSRRRERCVVVRDEPRRDGARP